MEPRHTSPLALRRHRSAGERVRQRGRISALATRLRTDGWMRTCVCGCALRWSWASDASRTKYAANIPTGCKQCAMLQQDRTRASGASKTACQPATRNMPQGTCGHATCTEHATRNMHRARAPSAGPRTLHACTSTPRGGGGRSTLCCNAAHRGATQHTVVQRSTPWCNAAHRGATQQDSTPCMHECTLPHTRARAHSHTHARTHAITRYTPRHTLSQAWTAVDIIIDALFMLDFFVHFFRAVETHDGKLLVR
jgi:hypothetical protein